jgi:hypothetical protein
MKTVATRIYELKQQITNCIDSGNLTWQYRAEGEFDQLMREAPSGSGFDSGTLLELATDNTLIFQTSFHHMNDNGMYIGWTHHRVVVKAVFGGISLRVTGENKRDIKEYIGEVFYHWLNTEVLTGMTPQLQREEKKRTAAKPKVLDYKPDNMGKATKTKELPALEHDIGSDKK